MRVKTDARRSAIVEAAWEAFKENGFSGTTMSDISARAGGSKATLYSYFESKDVLFFAALEDALAGQAEEGFARFEQPGALEPRLLAFANAYMDVRMSDDAIAVERMLVAEADRSDLGLVMTRDYIAPKRQRIATVLEREMEAGALRRADPKRTVAHLMALIEGDLVERRLRGEPSPPERVVREDIAEAVKAFLRAYAP